MRILNELDEEIQESDVDTNLGYLVPDQILKEHHEATPAVDEEGHYYPQTFYFEDGTRYDIPKGEDDKVIENDPHVSPNEDGVSFTYVPQEDEEEKEVRGTDVAYVIDVEHQDAKDAWDEMEDIQRYRLYTEDELREKAISAATASHDTMLTNQAVAFMSLMVAPMTLEMTDEDVRAFDLIMPDFVPGNEYENKAVVRYNGILYRAIQKVDSTTTTNYTPDQANSYWKRVGEPNEEGIYEWSQPYGATDCYQTSDKVTYQGADWTSTIDNNVWAPGVYGWKKDPNSGSEEPVDEYPDFVPPTGAHDAYKIGDKVTFGGKHYESVIDNNTWSPADYPAGWKEVPMKESEE